MSISFTWSSALAYALLPYFMRNIYFLKANCGFKNLYLKVDVAKAEIELNGRVEAFHDWIDFVVESAAP